MTMRPRKASGPAVKWPDDWTVRFEWEFTGPNDNRKPQKAVSRVHDLKIDNHWYQFERHVVTSDTEWVDCFELYPLGGFRAFRPGQVTAVRQHVEPKRKK